MGLIEHTKTYTGNDLETIFFRPMLTGPNAEELGIRVIYNMPMPTTIQLWAAKSDILQNYTSGWTGGTSADRKQKTIDMAKIKAELGFSASDYFNQVYELIVNSASVNLDDLSGTELERAETELFRKSIAESLRTMMWVGDVDSNSRNLFDGLLTKVYKYPHKDIDMSDITISADTVTSIFDRLWEAADHKLKCLKSEGNLAFFVTSNVCDAYELWLDKFGGDAAYTDINTGRRELSYHGIRIIDMNIDACLPLDVNESMHHVFLTDRRNLALAVNTADYPGAEVRMWYNPDEMENRQRATFLAGTEILDETLVISASFI